ncbi:hypothetical protein OF83DRAFT_1173006 [Amylostereum chailletii]|nr:hypothetical protein OF83DRAFT_1173006 [Amylostereum chailletii]
MAAETALWTVASNLSSTIQITSAMRATGAMACQILGLSTPGTKLSSIAAWIQEVETLLKNITPEQERQLLALQGQGKTTHVVDLRETLLNCKSDQEVVTLQYHKSPFYRWFDEDGVNTRINTLFSLANDLYLDTLSTSIAVKDGEAALRAREVAAKAAAAQHKKDVKDARILRKALSKMRRYFEPRTNNARQEAEEFEMTSDLVHVGIPLPTRDGSGPPVLAPIGVLPRILIPHASTAADTGL